MVKTTVGCIVEHDQKVVLLKRNHEPFKDTWVLPGGHIDAGETGKHAIIREVKEETSLDIDPHFFDYNDEVFGEWHAVALIFYAVGKGTLQASRESTEIRTFSFDDIHELKMGFNHKEILYTFYNE